MIGTILHFDSETDGGVLRGEDGVRYRFARADWASLGSPIAGDIVDFEPDNARATEIFVTSRIAVAEPPVSQGAPFVTQTPDTTVASIAPAVSGTTVTQIVAEAAPLAALPSSSSEPMTALGEVSMPSGLGARFFIAYLITLIPTYILPYFGSNSMLINGIGAEIAGGRPVQFWYHISAYAGLIFLAYIRGVRIARVWLFAFPIFAMFFDLVPVINNIPWVPSILNIAALYIGASRSAPAGYAPESLNTKIEFGLWAIAAFSAFAIFKIWMTPFNYGNPFASSMLLWPVLGLAGFFAFKYRIGEGAALVATFGGTENSAPEASPIERSTIADPQSAGTPVFSPSSSHTPSLKTAEPVAAVPSAASYCPQCGFRNSQGDSFCGDCGTGLEVIGS
ncbi:MAG: hypothetical protein RIS52_916 [Pseudomonadota bacterium]